MSSMRLCMNALHLVYGERDGVETEFEQILRHATSQRGSDEIFVLANRETARRIPCPEGAQIIECPVSGSSVLRRVWYEHRHVNRVCVEHAIDALLCFGAVLPMNLSIPGVLIINDMQPWIYPKYFAWYKRLYLYRAVEHSARRAHSIVTISEHSRNDIIRILGVDQDKVLVVPLSGPQYGQVTEPEVLASVRRIYNLPERYLLCLASSYPHKNLETLVEAYALFLQRDPDSHVELVLAGMAREAHGRIQQTARRLAVDERIHQPGRIAKKDLAALYSGAEGFVFPSLFEGFGMPVLEAMACKTPVASSDATALPEVYGDAALEFDPEDVEGMADAITRLLHNQQTRERLIERGYRRVQEFSWARTAAEILRILRQAGRSSGF